jgi:hypothetical protein
MRIRALECAPLLVGPLERHSSKLSIVGVAEEDQGVVKAFNYSDADAFFHRCQTRVDQSQAHASLRSGEVGMLL